jgi:hypothetical protein
MASERDSPRSTPFYASELLSEEYTREGGVALAVSLDIVNAFNSLS